MVYVDSGSTDGSVETARALGSDAAVVPRVRITSRAREMQCQIVGDRGRVIGEAFDRGTGRVVQARAQAVGNAFVRRIAHESTAKPQTFGAVGIEKFVDPFTWIGWMPTWMDGLLGMPVATWLSVMAGHHRAPAVGPDC